MNFAWPHLLWLLLLPAGLLGFELRRSRRSVAAEHPKILRAEAGLSSVSLVDDPSSFASRRRRYLLCAGLALSVVALARPRWGRLEEPMFDQSREIIIALDLSRSMLTPDVKPSRLERSKLLIQSLLDQLKGERVGLVVFSGTAFVQAPLSADYEILREFLPSLGPDFLPEGGTNYEQLISTTIDAFGDSGASDRYLIVLSDGEATDDDWRSRVPDLEKKGIRVIGLGVGTSTGAMIPDGAGSFMKDENGAVVLSKLESGTLKELAKATHGEYRDASDWVDLARVLSETVEQGKKGRFVEQSTARYVERYQWALAQALACLVASFWLEFPVRPKSREIRLSPGKVPRAAAAAAAFLALVLLAPRAAAAPAVTAETPPNPAAGLSKVVARLSSEDRRSAVDWVELGNETLTWGQHLKSSGQEVPEGPVRDALAAVELGQKADGKATDWGRMRTDLEELLRKPEDQKKKDEQQNKQNKDQDKDQKQDESQKDQKDGQQGKPQEKQENPQKQDQKQQSPSNPQDKNGSQGRQDNQKAFGDMKATPTPSPRRESQEPMQKVGGARKKEDEDPARSNPELAVPLEKLEQIKADDSPAELFEMLRRGEPLPTPTNKGKNW